MGYQKELESLSPRRPNLPLISSGTLSNMRFLGDSVGKESACSSGELSLILALGISPGEGNGNLLQYSCLGHPMEKGVWQAPVHGIPKSWA